MSVILIIPTYLIGATELNLVFVKYFAYFKLNKF